MKTEPPFTGKYWDHHEDGSYTCANCGQLLFKSDTKFDSGTGWPSFGDVEEGAVGTGSDHELGYERTTVHCSKCGSHLGHVFPDGPKPTGQRYCINSFSLGFQPK